MPEKKIRIVIDTNIWISFLIGKTLTGLGEALFNNQFIILFSDELFEELIEVLQRPNLKNIFQMKIFRN